VKQLFERARANAPVILFLDELDIIVPARNGSNDALSDEIVGQLLQELDGIQSRDSEVFLLAATNHAEQIDRAVLSRFQETLAIPLPDLAGPERLLTVLLQKKRVAFPLEEGARGLAAASERMSGRDLQSWIGRAEQKALLHAIAAGGPEHFALALADFELPATDRLSPAEPGFKPIGRSKAHCVCGDFNSLLLSSRRSTMPENIAQTVQKVIQDLVAPDVRELKVLVQGLQKQLHQRFEQIDKRFDAQRETSEAQFKALMAALVNSRHRANSPTCA
jgi:SpoVK/Ycf46/Vps4 family AAA+-type ATPase